MPDIATLVNHPDTTIAVVGANDDPAEYGFRVYRDLKAKGLSVLAVNPNRTTVDGDPSYPSLQTLPLRPTLLNLVVPPEVTLQVLHRAHDLGINNVWLQPGAESPAVIEYLEAKGFSYLAGACIMASSRALV